MLRNAIKWLFLLLIFSSPQSVWAQGDLQIDQLEVDIWPEYDRPDVLVIYRITLPESTDLPVDMSLRIPAAAGNPYNVAMKDVDGMLYNLDYTAKPDGDWTSITFTALSRGLQIEYYDPTLLGNGAARSYEYQWTGDYAVNSFLVSVQQPQNAVSFQVEPTMGTGRLGPDNLIYYTLLVGQLDAGSQWMMHLSYENPSNALSAELQPVEPIQPIPIQPEGTTIAQRWLIWGAGILGGLLILAGVFWFWRNNRKLDRAPSRHRHTSERGDTPSMKAGDGGVYCHQCGKLSMSGDVFCRACGTRLRSE